MPRHRFMPLALIALVAVSSLSFLVYAFIKTRMPHASPANSALPKLASLSQTSGIRTARNNLTVNLSDGHEVMSAFDGPPELRAALEHNQAHPLSLAAADFDEDGVPDLITGYEIQDQGAFSFMRGNVDSIYPNEPAAKQRLASGRFTQAPFLSPALLFDSPAPVDFVGAGDFDGDSHWDVVIASHSRNSLFLFSGNGKGSFAPAKETKLPGMATAFVVGEINRSDGLADIVVGINGPDGPAVLVFEGPEGALRASPEKIRLAHSASALALAPLTDSYEIDLAIAAGNELQLVRGRDRKLSLDQQQQADVLPLETRSRLFSKTIKAMSAGDFSGSGNSDLAVLFNDGELQLLINPGTVTESKSSRTTHHITRWKSLPSIKHWPGATSLTRVHVSDQPGDDLAIFDGQKKELEIWNIAENDNTSGIQPSEDMRAKTLPQEQTGTPL